MQSFWQIGYYTNWAGAIGKRVEFGATMADLYREATPGEVEKWMLEPLYVVLDDRLQAIADTWNEIKKADLMEDWEILTSLLNALTDDES